MNIYSAIVVGILIPLQVYSMENLPLITSSYYTTTLKAQIPECATSWYILSVSPTATPEELVMMLGTIAKEQNNDILAHHFKKLRNSLLRTILFTPVGLQSMTEEFQLQLTLIKNEKRPFNKPAIVASICVIDTIERYLHNQKK